MTKYKIAVIPGDGIGPEVMEATLYVLNNTNLNLEFIKAEAGLSAWKKYGNPLPQETINTIVNTNACLKGPTQTPPGPGTFRSPTVILRQMLELYANVRPFKSRKGVPSIHNNVDMVIIRENTEGLYTGLEYIIGDAAMAIRIISKRASERIARFAFNFARREGRKKVTIVHKANVLKETCGLFRGICLEISKEYPDVLCEEMLVDTAAMKIAMIPQIFDVIVTTNLFGDILSDEAAGITGGLGLAPSANIGDKYALFEAVHGSAPDIAGKGIANPSAMILSATMMLKYLGEVDVGKRIEAAIDSVIAEGKYTTKDLGGSAGTMDFAKAVVEKLNL
ncbi:MAG: isocitrate/isopropylmalate dehydrogenase family protein [Candidatus Methanomethyliaceae archaeon]|nr:isocitrate/isopropylmalate dehydrogenase family protein [Candidatus Methanomethyliaceae archaeon]MDW7971129.1 isocitrate/isopropylmalate dehydrogenase family protein [Nitrososphaerota archaeon]